MLCSLFLPIIIGLITAWCAILFFALPEDAGSPWKDYSTVFGVSSVWFGILLAVLPFILWFWMLWSGNWRRPVLTAAIVYGGFTVVMGFELVEPYTPPEKRTIYLRGIAGTDVYCNGVHLGQLPLRIRVDELIAKVPQWDTPPEQRWYGDTEHGQRLMTWVPWDDFIEERFEASRELFGVASTRIASSLPASPMSPFSPTSRAAQARREALNQHDAGARYWWTYRLGEVQMAFHQSGNTGYLNRPFEKQSNYRLFLSSFSPSVGFYAQLLADVLPELTPEQKADWDHHVLKHWVLLSEPLQSALNGAAARHRRNRNEPLAALYETALHSTARLHYGLSDPPTEEECRRLLADWVATNNWDMFQFDWSAPRMPRVPDSVLIPADINETMRQPLVEQWRKNKYRFELGWAPVVYFSWQNKSPDYFAEFARWSATTGKARIALLDNEAPGTAALFRTLLYRRDITETFHRQIDLYAGQIRNLSPVNNPLVETTLREYIVKALSDPLHTETTRRDVQSAVASMIFQRIDRDTIDKEEFAAWVASLPIPASTRSLALRRLRLRSDEPLTFADLLQQNASQGVLIETELTLEDVIHWFDENPEGDLFTFLKEQEENISASDMSERMQRRMMPGSGFFGTEIFMGDVTNLEPWGGFPGLFVLTLLRLDTPEGDPPIRELIRRMWMDTRTTHLVESVIASEYGSSPLRMDWRSAFAAHVGSTHVPEHFLDWYLSPEAVFEREVVVSGRIETVRHRRGMGIPMASTLALCESPKAGEILEQWVEEVRTAERPEDAIPGGITLRAQIERCLEIWQTRNALRQMKIEIFQDLVAGRIGPDDLLLPQPPWVWVDGEYVQREW